MTYINDPDDLKYSGSSFTIAGGNAQVVLSIPANNAKNVSKTPTFYWHLNGSGLGVHSYKVVYSKNELFNANVITLGPVTTTSASVSTDLEGGSTYWWHVEVAYESAPTSYSQASAIYKFTVEPGASGIVMPLVGSPANGVTIGTNTPYLSWYLPTQSSWRALLDREWNYLMFLTLQMLLLMII
ncbi:MAG: hypothetical protein U5K00_00590 [Melioribacteraceae bacterium]|nr:hypothetical protein [Melioribacteraceae bacterium]